MPNSTITGRVTALVTKPTRSVTITDGRNPGVSIQFTDLDADDFAVLVAAYNSGKTVTVTYSGSPPVAIGISQP